MARPGFVLEVDDRTPPLVVPDGDRFRTERFPLGTTVIYPADSLPAVPDLGEAIGQALDQPLAAEPLSAQLRAGMRLTIVVDDITTPVPRMRTPDVRGRIVEAVLTRAAAAGVDDVAVVTGTGLNRRMTEQEQQQVLGERVFRSFHADGLLTNHDAEDGDQLTDIGATPAGPLAVNARVAGSDLVVFVHLVTDVASTAGTALAAGIGSAATIGQIRGLAALTDSAPGEAVADQVSAAVPVFRIDAVLDNDAFPTALDFLTKREWELRIKERAAWSAVRRALSVAPSRTRRRWMAGAEAPYAPTLIVAGDPTAVAGASREQIVAQQRVEVAAQADVGVVGVPAHTPYSVDSTVNPVLAAWSGLAGLFGAHTGRPFVRDGGALIVFHPMAADFSPLHHPSYVDFFAEVLPRTTDPEQIRAEVEPGFATDPWYGHLYRTGYAFHGVHPLHRWYELSVAARRLSEVVFVGADRESVARLGFRAASTLADALEIVASSVGRSPAISYLHAPPQVLVDITGDRA